METEMPKNAKSPRPPAPTQSMSPDAPRRIWSLLLAAAILLLLGVALKSGMVDGFLPRAAPASPSPQPPKMEPKDMDLMRLFGSHVC
mgnify:CR=1 FL=1